MTSDNWIFFPLTSHSNESALGGQHDFHCSGPSKVKKKMTSTNKQHSGIFKTTLRKTVLEKSQDKSEKLEKQSKRLRKCSSIFFFLSTSNTNGTALDGNDDFQRCGPLKVRKKKPVRNKQHSEVPIATSRIIFRHKKRQV